MNIKPTGKKKKEHYQIKKRQQEQTQENLHETTPKPSKAPNSSTPKPNHNQRNFEYHNKLIT